MTLPGIVVRIAENFGLSPAIRINTPARPRTLRLTTFVIETIPTFWLKVAVGSPPKKDPMMLAMPFPIMPPLISASSGSRSSPPVTVAVRSPMASMEVTIYMMDIDRIALSSNFIPKYIGIVNCIQLAVPTESKLTIPRHSETM